MGKYFGTDGFRGEAGVTLTADHAYKVGRFLGWYYGMLRQRNGETTAPRVVIGKDTRRSSYMFEYSLVAGLTASGADAYLLHVTTTPSVAYIARVDDFDCGIMISASHNPYYDNGIKLIDCYGEKMDEETLLLVEVILDLEDASGDLMYWGSSRPMVTIRKTVDKIAPTDATVLITGENGTGKDVLAQEIHARSLRSGKPMVAVDAGAITETLFESELFGHVKGAFTDAHTDHVGKFEQADGGTLFLDEIGNIPLHLQAKLLRVIQNRSVVRVGGSKAIPVDIRLICATNMNLEQLVREGRFREDLYYRINTVHINLPPLRERKEDIVPLAQLFLERFSKKYHRHLEGLDGSAKVALEGAWWSGNIRELQNCIEKAVILSDGNELTGKDLQPEQAKQGASGSGTLRAANEAEEERLVREAMERSGGNISSAAKILGVSRPTLYAKLKKYGL